MIDQHNGRPGDVRNFVHKRIIGAIGGAIGGVIKGGPLGGIGGALGGFFGGGRKPAPVSSLPIPFVPQRVASCPPGFWRHPNGDCLPLQGAPKPGTRGALERLIPFGQTGVTEFGEAVMGQFGAALEPGFRESSTAVCPPGTVLGIDRLCYNKGDIKNKERAWPRGRKPLLTGGEMRCISIAAGAAKRLERKQKQLQKMGMLKKPSTSRRRSLPSGHHAHVSHDGSDH